jgi:transcriptional antiterminator NusG
MSETGTTAKQWFVVHTYSGFENKVASGIESRAKIFGLQDMIGRVIVPTEKVREIRKSKKIETEQKFFPGYLLVEMELTDDTWHLVRSTPKAPVRGPGSAVALPGRKSRILRQMEEGAESPSSVHLPEGDKVRGEGPFELPGRDRRPESGARQAQGHGGHLRAAHARGARVLPGGEALAWRRKSRRW